MFKFIAYTFRGASYVLGTIIAAITVAALIVRQFGIVLPEFPKSLIGLYETIRWYVFGWWVPNWWPTWLSDLIVIYLSIAFSHYRGMAMWSGKQLDFSAVSLSLRWPIIIPNWWKKSQSKSYPRSKHAREVLLLAVGSIVLTLIFAVGLLQWEYLQNLAGF